VGPGARALSLEHGQVVERDRYDLLFGQRKAPDATPLSRPPDGGRNIADLYARLLAAEPHATADCRRELRIEAMKQARQSPLFFDLPLSLSADTRIHGKSLISCVNARSFSASPDTESETSETSIRR
jgi:hypothetical protein